MEVVAEVAADDELCPTRKGDTWRFGWRCFNFKTLACLTEELEEEELEKGFTTRSYLPSLFLEVTAEASPESFACRGTTAKTVPQANDRVTD
jgi:hypothetical protein